MIRIKVFKLSQLIYYAVIIVVAVALIGLIASALIGGSENSATKTPGAVTTRTPESPSGTIPTKTPESSPSESAPGATETKQTTSRSAGEERQEVLAASTSAVTEGPEESGLFRRLSTFLLGFDPADPASILSYHLPVSVAPSIPSAVPVNRSEALLLSAEIDISENELSDTSDVGEHILIEIAGIEEKYIPASRGRILIYHTHTYEAYEQDESDPYKEASAQWRTKERDHSIVGVGDALEKYLTALGYEVVHDTTEFEPPKLGTAYVRSLEMLDRRVAAGEEYAMIIDLHRDAWDKVQAKQMTATVDGEPAARLMMLIGTGEGSDGNTFKIKPNWKENYKLADALTTTLNSLYPGLCRDVMLKTGRYNQHISEHAILIEVGNNRNSLSEALNAMPALATAIDRVLTGN